MATGKFSRFPSATDDVVRATAEDAGKVRKAFGSGTSGAAKDAVGRAAGRAASRIAARAGAAGAAASLGWDVGRSVDELTGAGKKLVDATVGDDVENSITRGPDRVKLTKSAQDRIDNPTSSGRGKINPPAVGAAKSEDKPSPKAKPADKSSSSAPKASVREGSNANIDDDVRKRAMASVGMKKGGSVRGYGKARGGKSCKMR